MSVPALSDVTDRDTACIHATCVAVHGKGVLIVGASGTGKSGLGLQMIALGAELVADDRVDLRMENNQLMAAAVAPISGLIEARGIGLLRAIPSGPVRVGCVVDLDHSASARLPDPVTIRVLRQTVPLLHAADIPNLASALIQLLKMGRVDPEWPST